MAMSPNLGKQYREEQHELDSDAEEEDVDFNSIPNLFELTRHVGEKQEDDKFKILVPNNTAVSKDFWESMSQVFQALEIGVNEMREEADERFVMKLVQEVEMTREDITQMVSEIRQEIQQHRLNVQLADRNNFNVWDDRYQELMENCRIISNSHHINMETERMRLMADKVIGELQIIIQDSLEKEKIRNEEEMRLREERERLERERLEQIRMENERLEFLRMEHERVEKEKMKELEIRLEKERKEIERIREELERKEKERIEEERKLENERMAIELHRKEIHKRIEEDRKRLEEERRLENERLAIEQYRKEQERIEDERKRMEEERLLENKRIAIEQQRKEIQKRIEEDRNQLLSEQERPESRLDFRRIQISLQPVSEVVMERTEEISEVTVESSANPSSPEVERLKTSYSEFQERLASYYQETTKQIPGTKVVVEEQESVNVERKEEQTMESELKSIEEKIMELSEINEDEIVPTHHLDLKTITPKKVTSSPSRTEDSSATKLFDNIKRRMVEQETNNTDETFKVFFNRADSTLTVYRTPSKDPLKTPSKAVTPKTSRTPARKTPRSITPNSTFKKSSYVTPRRAVTPNSRVTTPSNVSATTIYLNSSRLPTTMDTDSQKSLSQSRNIFSPLHLSKVQMTPTKLLHIQKMLKTGHVFWKHSSSGGSKKKLQHVFLSHDNQYLCYIKPELKKLNPVLYVVKKKFPITSIRFIQRNGEAVKLRRQAEFKNSLTNTLFGVRKDEARVNPHCMFSIVMTSRVLDLEAKTAETAQIWAEAFEKYIIHYNNTSLNLSSTSSSTTTSQR